MTFGTFTVVQAFLAFTEWGYRQASTLEAAQRWVDAGAVWPLSLAALWSFGWMMSFDGRRQEVVRWRHAMYLPAVVFTALNFFASDAARTARLEWWGYTYSMARTPLVAAEMAWGLCTITATAVLVVVMFVRRDQRMREVYRAFVVATVVNIAAGLVTPAIQAVVSVPVPELSTLGIGLFVILIGFAVYRHGVWEFAPRVAAETVLQTMGDAVLMVDQGGAIRYANAAAGTLLGREIATLGISAADVLPNRLLDSASLGAGMEAVVNACDGSKRHVSARIEPMPTGGGGRVVVLRDAEEQMLHQQELSHLAYHDPLTGLGNRESFFRDLATQCDVVRADPIAYSACIVLDLDRFKEINDGYGHGAGDDVLIETASRLQRAVRTADDAYRLGGDEFAVLLRGMRRTSDVCLWLHRPDRMRELGRE